MTIGTSLLLIALGAILRFAVTADVSGISIATVGTILLVVGAIGLVIGLFLLMRERSAASAVERRTVVRERAPGDPYP